MSSTDEAPIENPHEWIIDARTVGEVREIARLLAEAYEHYFKNSDGHCKSSEGAISIHMPVYFWREEDKPRPGIEIYSYALGPSRTHDFPNASHALEAVREWHQEEMARDYDEY